MMDLLSNRNISLSLTCCFTFGFVLGLSFLVASLYTLSLSDSPPILALVVGTFPLTALLLSLASGAFADYFGRRLIIISGFAFMASGCLTFAVSKSYYSLLVGQVLIAFGGIASMSLHLHC